jgi:H+/gluconate symporter-like permease
MAERYGRNLIRLLIGAALCASLTTCTVVPVPGDLPAVAFGQASLYRLEIALLVFYSGLLLITPAFSGLIYGRLPIEISVRGAKFEEEADQSVQIAEGKLEGLEQEIRDLTDELTIAAIAIDQLKEGR